jgi:hypothetical protein
MSEISTLARKAYGQAHALLRDEQMASVVNNGMNILYGPPIQRPDLALITFQGGGADKTIQQSWPNRLLYLDDPYKFGGTLRSICTEVGLAETLETSTVAMPTVFPQAPVSEAGKWMSKTGPRAKWSEFSLGWLDIMMTEMRPKTVVLFGTKASQLVNVNWEEAEFNHSQNHQTYGVAELFGAKAIYCHHLSIGCPRNEALKCFKAVRNELE